MVSRESEWTESDRGRALHFAEYERSIDKTTGLPITTAYDPHQAFLVDFSINHAERAIETMRATHAEAHKDNPGWQHGRRYFAQPVDPADMPDAPQTTARRRRPTPD